MSTTSQSSHSCCTSTSLFVVSVMKFAESVVTIAEYFGQFVFPVKLHKDSGKLFVDS